MLKRKRTQHKTRPKLLTIILSMMLAISMIVPVVQYNTLQVNATGMPDTNVDGQGNGAAPENVTGGQPVSYKRTGWLVYISDRSGNLRSPVKFAGLSIPPASYKAFFETRIGGQTHIDGTVNLAEYPSWPLPVTASGTNAGVLKDYVKKNPNLIESVFGPDIASMCNADKDNFYLIMETVSWHAVPGRTYNGCGNHWGWVRAQEKGEASPSGKGFYPYNVLALSEFIEKPWPGLPPVVTSKSYGATDCIPLPILTSAGYGMAAFRIGEHGEQSTADEASPAFGTSPHDPPDESEGVKTIIKNYRTVNDTTNVITDDGKTHRDNVDEIITVEEEGDYKVIGWKTSNTKDYGLDSIKWPVPGKITQQGKEPTTVTLNSPLETVIYVWLEKHEEDSSAGLKQADFIISESTISRKIQLSKPDKSRISLVNQHEFKWNRSAHETTCHGHTYTWSEDCGDPECHGCPHSRSETHYCSFGRWSDNTMGQSLDNTLKLSSPKIVATKAGQQGVVSKTTGLGDNAKWTQTVTTSKTDADIQKKVGVDYRCILMRGQDKLTVASWKNSELGKADANSFLGGLSSEGFSVGNSDMGTRKTSLYYDSFSVNLRWDNTNRSTIYSSNGACGHGSQCGPNSRDYSLANPYNANVDVEVQTYAGSATGGQNDTYYDGNPSSKGIFGGMPILSGLNQVLGVEVPSGASLNFRPYIQMNYDKMAQNHQAHKSATAAPHLTAYVLGELDRIMTPNDYAEVSWKSRTPDKPNLTLNSLQWSTHSSAVDFISNKLGAGNLSKFTVLPGGATLDLTIKDSDRQRVVATTYQCVVDGTGKTQIDNAGGSYAGLTPTDAESAHDAYADSVKNGLEGIGVVQWVTNNIGSVNGSNIDKDSSNVWNISGSSEVYWGQNLDAAGHSDQTASLETKYYFADDGEHPEAPASEGDLDVEVKGKTSKKYTFYVNTFGEMYMLEDNVSGNQRNERAGTKVDPNAPSGIAKQINDRTHVIDKLYKAVEKGTGKDESGRSKTGVKWYNEAFDGVTVYVQSTEFMVGYIDPPSRSTVLDPKLTQTQDNQSDMFNKDKYNMSQYRTKNYSVAYPGTEEKVGEFKGASVYLKDMEMLFHSRKFFIPNATVDDLH